MMAAAEACGRQSCGCCAPVLCACCCAQEERWASTEEEEAKRTSSGEEMQKPLKEEEVQRLPVPSAPGCSLGSQPERCRGHLWLLIASRAHVVLVQRHVHELSPQGAVVRCHLQVDLDVALSSCRALGRSLRASCSSRSPWSGSAGVHHDDRVLLRKLRSSAVANCTRGLHWTAGRGRGRGREARTPACTSSTVTCCMPSLLWAQHQGLVARGVRRSPAPDRRDQLTARGAARHKQ